VAEQTYPTQPEGKLEKLNLNSCSCFAVRKAARRLTQIYDGKLASCGIRSTQYSILAVIWEHGVVSVNQLAKIMVIDRTTMGKNLLPLEREGLLNISVSKSDRRGRDISLTSSGKALLRRAFPLWKEANDLFQRDHGKQFTETLRKMLGEVTSSEL
jgi:DNA-binding MarR family transcriptional regulator